MVYALERRVAVLEAALRTLLEEPGNPFHASEQALRVLDISQRR